MTYQRIMIPLDGSELAERALPYARSIALNKNSELILFAVSVTTSSDRMDRLMQSYLELKAKSLESEGLNVSIEVAYGSVADEIINFSDKNNIDLIIISSHGYSGIKRWMLGSIAQKVLYGTCVPVLLIKSKSPEVANIQFKKVLITLDGSSFSETPISYIEELTKGIEIETEVTLLQVIEPPIVPSYGSRPINPKWGKYRDELWSETQQQATKYLENMQATLKGRGIKTKLQIIQGDVAKNIIQTAKTEKVDLIAMATHGRTGVSHWVYGSIANKIIEDSPQPIMLVRPSQPVE